MTNFVCVLIVQNLLYSVEKETLSALWKGQKGSKFALYRRRSLESTPVLSR